MHKLINFGTLHKNNDLNKSTDKMLIIFYISTIYPERALDLYFICHDVPIHVRDVPIMWNDWDIQFQFNSTRS